MNAFTSMHASLRMASYVPHLFAVNNLCFNYTFSVCKCFRLFFFLFFFFTGIKCWKSSQCVSLRHFNDGYVYRHFISSQAIKCIYVLILIASFVYLIINEILPYFGCLNFTGKKKNELRNARVIFFIF